MKSSKVILLKIAAALVLPMILIAIGFCIDRNIENNIDTFLGDSFFDITCFILASIAVIIFFAVRKSRKRKKLWEKSSKM